MNARLYGLLLVFFVCHTVHTMDNQSNSLCCAILTADTILTTIDKGGFSEATALLNANPMLKLDRIIIDAARKKVFSWACADGFKLLQTLGQSVADLKDAVDDSTLLHKAIKWVDPIITSLYEDTYFTSEQGQLVCVKDLLEHGADPHAKDKEGNTPLSLASQQGDSQIIALLEGRTTQETVARAFEELKWKVWNCPDSPM